MAIATKSVKSISNPSFKKEEMVRTLDVRTNLYANKKFISGEAIKRGNASPVTTHAGRIAVGEHGAFWAGQLNAFSVWIDEDQDWSCVMYDENSPASGLVGVVTQMLLDLEILGTEPSEKDIADLKQQVYFMDARVELPWNQEDVLDLREMIVDSGTHHLIGSIELNVGVKGGGDDTEIVLRGSFVGDQQINAGKLSIVESNNRVVIGRSYSSYARSVGVEPETLTSAFKAGLKSQRQKCSERRAKYQARKTQTTAAGLEDLATETQNHQTNDHGGLPPVC